MRGAFEVALLSRQDSGVARATQRGGQPADFEVGADGERRIGAAKREHHARPRQEGNGHRGPAGPAPLPPRRQRPTVPGEHPMLDVVATTSTAPATGAADVSRNHEGVQQRSELWSCVPLSKDVRAVHAKADLKLHVHLGGTAWASRLARARNCYKNPERENSVGLNVTLAA